MPYGYADAPPGPSGDSVVTTTSEGAPYRFEHSVDGSDVLVIPTGEFGHRIRVRILGVQQGDATLFVRPEPGDLWVVWAYPDRALTVQGSESCPAIPFFLQYDLAFTEGWNTFPATFMSHTDARNHRVTTGDAPDEAAWFRPESGPSPRAAPATETPPARRGPGRRPRSRRTRIRSR